MVTEFTAAAVHIIGRRILFDEGISLGRLGLLGMMNNGVSKFSTSYCAIELHYKSTRSA
uniref:Uncharacterized protein n=1 Tax=Candidozyma auris TaxID=498019 RepID=A0A0L0NSS8_CANAR